MTVSLEHLGGVYAALHAGHMVGDYWAQTGRCAEVKGKPGRDGRRACATHVATLTAVQAVFLASACLATGERLSVRRVVLGLAVNAVSHYAIDRRDHGVMPVLCRALRRFGKDDYMRTPLGAAHLDQAWHIAWCAITAAIITGRSNH